MFIWTAVGGINGWCEEEAKAIVYESSKIPFGTVNDWMMPYELLGVAKDPYEQVYHAARTALKIPGDQKAADIPVDQNKKARLLINMKLAKKMGIKFDLSLIENAHLIRANTIQK